MHPLGHAADDPSVQRERRDARKGASKSGKKTNVKKVQAPDLASDVWAEMAAEEETKIQDFRQRTGS